MMKIDKKEYATLQEYGFRDFRHLKKVLKVLNVIGLILVIGIMYLSIAVIFIQSVNSSSDVTSFGNFTFKWYGEIFQHRSLRRAITNTFVVSIVTTIIATIVGTFVAIGIHSLEKKKKQRIMLVNNIPILNADIVTGISLMLIFSLVLPIFPYIFGPVTLVVAHLFFTLPYVILSVLPKLREVDTNLMDAALDLGVKPYKALLKVVIPSISAGIFAGMLMSFTMSLDDFVISYFNTGNGFDNLSIWIYGSIGRRSLTPAVYAFSSLLTIVTLAALVGFNFLQSKRKVKK